MDNNLVKCSKSSCNNYRSNDTESESDLCLVCEERRLVSLEKKISKKPKQIAPAKKVVLFKSKDELNNYDYSVCILKNCRKRVFMRDRCKKDYIDFMSKNTKNN